MTRGVSRILPSTKFFIRTYPSTFAIPCESTRPPPQPAFPAFHSGPSSKQYQRHRLVGEEKGPAKAFCTSCRKECHTAISVLTFGRNSYNSRGLGKKRSVLLGATINMCRNWSQILYLLPHNHVEESWHCDLVGGGAYPGSGLPTIFESARMSLNLLCEKYGILYPKPKRFSETDLL